MRILETTPPLEVGLAGVEVTPGPSHWKTGVSVTPLGREMEQVRVTESPAMTVGEEGVREMVAGSVIPGKMHTMYSSVFRSIEMHIVTQGLVKCVNNVPIVALGPVVKVLCSVLELATILME